MSFAGGFDDDSFNSFNEAMEQPPAPAAQRQHGNADRQQMEAANALADLDGGFGVAMPPPADLVPAQAPLDAAAGVVAQPVGRAPGRGRGRGRDRHGQVGQDVVVLIGQGHGLM